MAADLIMYKASRPEGLVIDAAVAPNLARLCEGMVLTGLLERRETELELPSFADGSTLTVTLVSYHAVQP